MTVNTKGKIPQAQIKIVHGHTQISITPSVTFTGGGISFTREAYEQDDDVVDAEL